MRSEKICNNASVPICNSLDWVIRRLWKDLFVISSSGKSHYKLNIAWCVIEHNMNLIFLNALLDKKWNPATFNWTQFLSLNIWLKYNLPSNFRMLYKWDNEYRFYDGSNVKQIGLLGDIIVAMTGQDWHKCHVYPSNFRAVQQITLIKLKRPRNLQNIRTNIDP